MATDLLGVAGVVGARIVVVTGERMPPTLSFPTWVGGARASVITIGSAGARSARPTRSATFGVVMQTFAGDGVAGIDCAVVTVSAEDGLVLTRDHIVFRGATVDGARIVVVARLRLMKDFTSLVLQTNPVPIFMNEAVPLACYHAQGAVFV